MQRKESQTIESLQAQAAEGRLRHFNACIEFLGRVHGVNTLSAEQRLAVMEFHERSLKFIVGEEVYNRELEAERLRALGSPEGGKLGDSAGLT